MEDIKNNTEEYSFNKIGVNNAIKTLENLKVVTENIKRNYGENASLEFIKGYIMEFEKEIKKYNQEAGIEGPSKNIQDSIEENQNSRAQI